VSDEKLQENVFLEERFSFLFLHAAHS